MHPKVKLTDLICSVTTDGRIVFNEKIKCLLAASINPDMGDLMPIKVWHNRRPYEYWIFNPARYQLDVIDFERSEIWLVKSGVEQEQQFFTDPNIFLIELRIPSIQNKR